MVNKLKKKSVFLTILLVVITFGIYNFIWFFKQEKAINNLNSPKKISPELLACGLLLSIISLFLIFFEQTKFVTQSVRFLSLIGAIIGLVMSFRTKRIIEDHFKIKLSGVATFFFTIFYLQYKINKVIDKKYS